MQAMFLFRLVRGPGLDSATIRAFPFALIFSAACVAIGVARGRASEIAVFDFETVAARDDYPWLQLSQDRLAVTIRHPNIRFAVNRRIEGPRFDAALGWQAFSAFNGFGGTLDPGPFVVDFGLPVSRASIDMGDFGEDDDLLVVEAYSGPGGTGRLVARDRRLLVGKAAQFDFATLAVQAPSIRSLVMIGGSPTFPNSVFYDNLTVTLVPEPAGWLTMCIALACLVMRK